MSQTTIKEKPILFTADMVRKILAGEKTQTRREVKAPASWITEFGFTTFTPLGYISGRGFNKEYGPSEKFYKSPHGWIGDQLYVREGFSARTAHSCGESGCECGDFWIYYAAGGKEWFSESDIRVQDWSFDSGRSYPSIHMPRWASRIQLEITNVRVERMQEGGDREFWGENNWKRNPWVWVYDFKVLRKSADNNYD